MDGETISWLNNIGAGTFVAIIIVLVGVIAGLVKFTLDMLQKHKMKVEEETLDDVAMNEVVNLVKKIDKNVNCLNERIEKEERDISELTRKIEENKTISENLKHDVGNLTTTVDDVIDSNQSAIRAFITSEYQKWMEKQKIDIYSLFIIEDRYKIYESRNGNTFVADIMRQLRKLPIITSVVDADGNDPVNYFSTHPHPASNVDDKK